MELTHNYNEEVPGSKSIHKPGPVGGAVASPQTYLLIGTALAASTGPKGVPTRLFSSDEGHVHWGFGSDIGELAEMIMLINPAAIVYGLGMAEDGGHVDAAGTVSIVGTATSAGLIELQYNGHKVRAAVAIGDTGADIVAALVAASASEPKLNVILTVGSPTTSLVATCKWGGTSGNTIGVRLISGADIGGLTFTVPKNLTGGAGDPDEATIVANIDTVHYKYVVPCFTTDALFDLLEPWAESRWQGLKAKRVHILGSAMGSLGTVLAELGNRNHSASTIVVGGLSPSAGWVCAGAYAGYRSVETNPSVDITGRDLGRFVITPDSGDEFTIPEQDQIIKAGGSTMDKSPSGNMQISTFLTTYTTTPTGAKVQTYKYFTSMLSLATIHETLEARVQDTFRNRVLVSDDKEPIAGHEFKLSSVNSFVKSLFVGPLSSFFFDAQHAASTVRSAKIGSNPGFIRIDSGSTELTKPFQGAMMTLTHT